MSAMPGARAASFNPTAVLAQSFGDFLSELYLQHFSGRKPEYAAFIGGGARLVLERLGNSDALYHDAEHTMMVTLVGQQIMRGRLMSEPMQPEDWLHFTVALLVHDIGYARGACKGDGDGRVVINQAGDTIEMPPGASDAYLAPYHVDRGAIYARERFADSEFIDQERIVRAIEHTRFPVPDEPHFLETKSEPALVRAADLIGQLGDPFYHRKKHALYYEFAEIGVAERLGYRSPQDLTDHYPEFFWSEVHPYLGAALGFLEHTVEGRQWVAQLYNHVFQVERIASGETPGGNAPGRIQSGGP